MKSFQEMRDNQSLFGRGWYRIQPETGDSAQELKQIK
jgi:hypothetical protein